jgi:hypothetical protein
VRQAGGAHDLAHIGVGQAFTANLIRRGCNDSPSRLLGFSLGLLHLTPFLRLDARPPLII